jgi:hypothetical protein
MPDQPLYLTDGAIDFVGGVDSGKVPLLQSPSNPNGLRRDQLAWLTNGTVRGGGITQRGGWKYLTTIHEGGQRFQGGYLYEPKVADPFLVTSIGGHIYRTVCEAGGSTIDLSDSPGLENPADAEQAYFVQGEEFLVIQAGDYGQIPVPTLPLFYDAHTMWRSVGILGAGNPGNQIPAALAMDYYQNRIWYSQIRQYTAGDIVGGPSGTVAYQNRDSILYVTENPLAIGGDGFAVPTNSGPIRALAHSAAIDTTLGQAQLFAFTRKSVYSLEVPITRAAWTASTEPLQKVIQNRWGTTSDRSIVEVNSDLFYQTMLPGINSLALAVRYFKQWGNKPISRNINRVLNFNDRALLRFASGMQFDNRLYQTALPFDTAVGTAHQAVVTLDFDPIGSFQEDISGGAMPSWEGLSEGLSILQLFSGDFGGLERAFAVIYSQVESNIQLWEFTKAERFENGEASGSRVSWYFETPMFPFGDTFQMKELQGGELWIDRLYGQVHILVEYRPDGESCWFFWVEFDQCVARNSCEDTVSPVCYPLTTYQEDGRKPLRFPHPPLKACRTNGLGPTFQGHGFQLRITITGFCRVRGLMLYATPIKEGIYEKMVC